MVFREEDYLKALVEINHDDFSEKKWLEDNIELYLSTVNWPKGLPPIGRSTMVKGSFQEKFHLTYESILEAHR